MVKYSREPDNQTKSCKARGSDLRVHFKLMWRTGEDAITFHFVEIAKLSVLTPVLLFYISEHKRDSVFNPEDAFGQGQNVKGLDVDTLYISHIQVNQAAKQRRRTYRAHGRINPYMSSPCHIELILSEKEEPVKKEADTQIAPRKPKGALRSGASS
ncbi:60S RIBOSOMAL PROTEIN L17 [Salix viminalis]|uniref:60S RIBOSOMAL PROTEIN L17 n=1 Tax=Salix viminalis TaxID=40686 RepID=A0A9Q0NV52_SALVM|nr:60S RIBOSOMAL PROTEIN L17 [Salix viminalis]